MANAKNYRFDSVGLEKAALDAWKEWYKCDTADNRMTMFTAIQDLTYAILKIGNWDAKYGLPLGEKETAYEYTIYLFERLITKSKLLQSVPSKVKVKGAKNDADAKAKIRKKIKNKFKILSVEYSDEQKLHLVEILYDKFALSPYINFNLRHIVLKNQDSATDYVGLIKNIEQMSIDEPDYESALIAADGNPSTKFSNKYLPKKVFKALKIFYPDSEIRRMLPLAMNVLKDSAKNLTTMPIPTDLKDFLIVLVSTSKKISSENKFIKFSKFKNKNYEVALKNAVNSSVFLSSVVNTNFFPRELLLALDMDSLSRLATIAGGKEIKIPTQGELNSLLGATSAITQVVLGKEVEVEGKKELREVTVEQAVKNAKGDLELVFSHKINIKKFIYQALESYDVFREEKESHSVFSMLKLIMNSLEQVFEELVIDAETADPEQLAETYVSLAESATKFTNSLVNLSNVSKSKLESLEDDS